MRTCPATLLLLFIAVMSSPSRAQQGAVPSSKKVDSLNLNLPRSSENWQGLTDLKTGLEPRPPALVQGDDQPEFVRDLIRLQWRDEDPIELWVIRPKVAGKVPEKVPVILYLYGYPDTSDRFRDNSWCRRATADGFAAVGFVAAVTDYRIHNRPLSNWFVSELPEALGSTTHDIQLTLNYLAERGDLDTEHVGVFGMGSGGTIAILAAYADPRISTVDVLDPWGDWPEWLKNSPIVPVDERPKYLTKEFLQAVAGLDPVSYFPVLHTPNVRLQQIVSEPATPSAAKQMIGAAAPDRITVVRYQNAVDLLKAWEVAGLSGWIKQQIRAEKSEGQDGHIAKNE